MSESKPPMQLNKQVGYMILITLGALFIPILGVGWFARDIVESRRAAATRATEPSPELDKTLRESLERSVDQAFSAEEFSLADDDSTATVSVTPDQVEARVKFLETEITRAGGTAVTIPEENGATRILVTAPESNLPIIRQSFAGVSQPYPETADATSGLMEIRVEPQP